MNDEEMVKSNLFDLGSSKDASSEIFIASQKHKLDMLRTSN